MTGDGTAKLQTEITTVVAGRQHHLPHKSIGEMARAEWKSLADLPPQAVTILPAIPSTYSMPSAQRPGLECDENHMGPPVIRSQWQLPLLNLAVPIWTAFQWSSTLEIWPAHVSCHCLDICHGDGEATPKDRLVTTTRMLNAGIDGDMEVTAQFAGYRTESHGDQG